jgi:hypothetical protein
MCKQHQAAHNTISNGMNIEKVKQVIHIKPKNQTAPPEYLIHISREDNFAKNKIQIKVIY